jgi:hypothetical protein
MNNAPLSSLSPSERAWQWWQAAWALFLRNPRAFLFLGSSYLALCFLVLFMSQKGWWPVPLLFFLAQPFLIAWLFKYIRVVHQPETRIRRPSSLLAGQKKSWLWYLLWRSRYSFPGLLRFFWHLNSDCRLSAGQARVLMRIGMIGVSVFLLNAGLKELLLRMGGAPWAVFSVLSFSLIWGMAFWCAPLLAIWRHHSAVKSLLFSFLTAWFNWRPILCVLFLLFAVTMGPVFLLSAFIQGWLFLALLCVFWLPVIVMIYFCLIYQMYLDFFPFPAPVSEHA